MSSFSIVHFFSREGATRLRDNTTTHAPRKTCFQKRSGGEGDVSVIRVTRMVMESVGELDVLSEGGEGRADNSKL